MMGTRNRSGSRITSDRTALVSSCAVESESARFSISSTRLHGFRKRDLHSLIVTRISHRRRCSRTLKLRIAFEQLKKDILGNIIGIGAIAQIRQCDPKHDIPVIFDRLSKCLFFHNHLPVTFMILVEALTIDTLLPDEMFQIQAGKTYQNKPVPYWQRNPLLCAGADSRNGRPLFKFAALQSCARRKAH